MVASLVYDFDFMTSCVCLVFFLFGSEERLWYSVIFARVFTKKVFFYFWVDCNGGHVYYVSVQHDHQWRAEGPPPRMQKANLGLE
jgi:hypothetical protein